MCHQCNELMLRRWYGYSGLCYLQLKMLYVFNASLVSVIWGDKLLDDDELSAWVAFWRNFCSKRFNHFGHILVI